MSITFLSGYTARQMFVLVESMLGEIPISCYEDRFEIKHALIIDENVGKKIVIHFTPHMNSILNYTTNPKYFNSQDCHILSPPNKEFISYVNSTAKKDPLELLAYSNDPSSLYVNIIKAGSSGKGNSKFKNSLYNKCTIINNDKVSKPNVKIPLNDICTLCSSISKSKNSYKGVLFNGYQRGINITGDSHTDVAALGDEWGVCDPDEYIGTYKIALDKNKAISAINNITEAGVVSFFLDKNKMKMQFPIGSYGEMLIVFDNGGIDEGSDEEVDMEEDFSGDDDSIGGRWFKTE